MPKVLADMHLPPAARRWSMRLGLAIVVAIGIGYLPQQALSRDPRAVKLDGQLQQQRSESRELAAGNAAIAREIAALRTDVSAIEDRARADLGMVYPDEIVLRVHHAGEPTSGGVAPAALVPAVPAALAPGGHP